MGVHDVGCLSEADVRQIELSSILWQPDLVGRKDGEATADHILEATFAILVEVGGASFDGTNHNGLVIRSVVSDNSLGFFGGQFSLLELLRSFLVHGNVGGSH